MFGKNYRLSMRLTFHCLRGLLTRFLSRFFLLVLAYVKVVLAAMIGQHEILRRRQMRHKALGVASFALSARRFAQSYRAGFARTQVSNDALDRAILIGRIAPFEDNENLVVGVDRMALQLDQFDLQAAKRLLVYLLRSFRDGFA